MKRLHFITRAICVMLLVSSSCLLAGEMVVDAWHLSDNTEIVVTLTYFSTDGHQEFYQVPFSIGLIDTVQYILEIPQQPGGLNFNFYDKYWRVGDGWEPQGSFDETTIFVTGWEDCAFDLYYIGGQYNISLTSFLPDVGIGSVLPIEWAADSGVQATSSVVIELSRNGGTSWSLIDTVSYNYNGSEYEWLADEPASFNCKIRLGMSDYAGNQSSAISTTFSIIVDADFDGISEDGDWSGVEGDHPCAGGNTTNCDDNCPTIANSNQYDPDSDGVGNVCDNCYYEYNPDQSDTDGDGVGNVCDNCPDVQNPSQYDYGEDGLADACDNCPYMVNDDQADSIGDGQGDVCDFFNDPVLIPIPNHPRAVFSMDLNGDGINDLVYSNTNDDKIAVYLNNGDSSLVASGIYFVDTNQVYGIGVDVDGDGDIDIATANSESHSISILKNAGDGSFDSPVNYNVDGICKPTRLCFGRFDSDFDADLAVCCDDDGIRVLTNDGSGAFVNSATYLSGTTCNSIITIDVDNNESADIIVGTGEGFVVLSNDGNGVFSNSQSYSCGGQNILTVISSEINGDHYHDIVWLSESDVGTFLNDGLGVFNNNGMLMKWWEGYPGEYNCLIVSADYDGDRDNDLALSKSVGLPRLTIILNDGQGTFTSGARYKYGLAGAVGLELISADMDGDFSPDLVSLSKDMFMANYYPEILLNRKPFAYACGDANGDGNTNVGDAVFIIAYIFQGGPPPSPMDAGDANCDGSVDVGDAVFLINFVFKGGLAPCCP